MRTKTDDAGENLAKVALFYGLIDCVSSSSVKIVCPIHDDVNPSMQLDFSTGFWFCYGCNKCGTAYDLVREIEKVKSRCNDLKAYQKYLKIISLDGYKGKQFRRLIKKQRKESDKQLDTEAQDYYNGLSKVDWNVPKNDDELKALKYMNDRGFSAQTLNQCKAKANYSTNYGLIFPMLDNNIFRGWVCRTMDAEVAKKRKYLYNRGFRRATTLVGDYGSKDYIIIVEGFMDLLKMQQNGNDNVVAILGWKVSDEQIKKLKDAGIKTIISALDNDECGRKGTKYVSKYFDTVRFRYLKGTKDPGDMSKESFDKMWRKTREELKHE